MIKKSIIIFLSMILTIVAHSNTTPKLPLEHCIAEHIDCSILPNPQNTTPSFLDEVKENYCSRQLLKRVAPYGTVSIFGGAHLFDEKTPEYQLIRIFARKWTELPVSDKWPIASGGGPGIMEAAQRGATEAKDGKGIAIGLHTPVKHLGRLEKISDYRSNEHYFNYQSISKRESDLMDHAQAVIIGPGGLGTLWEMFETLDKIHIGAKPRIPVIILAPNNKGEQLAQSFLKFIHLGLVPESDCRLLNITNSADKAIELILMSADKRELDSSSSCFLYNSEPKTLHPADKPVLN